MSAIIRGGGSRESVGKRPRERDNVIYGEKGECPLKSRMILTSDHAVNRRPQ